MVPKVNPEVTLDHATKTADLKLQKRQKILMKAVYAATQTCNIGFQNASENRNLLKI